MEVVEREAVLAELAELWAEAGKEGGRLALVSGEAGVGKTAVVRRFSETNGSAARVLEGACDPLATPRPLGPLSDIAAVVGGELARLLDEESGPAAVFDAFLRVLAGSPQPTLVVLEDVHWADEATLDLLSFVGRRLSRMHALVVVTFRDDEVAVDHPLRLAIGDLPGAPAVRRLPLQPLSEQGVAALARAKHLDPGRLYRLTGGNPLFVTEVLATEGGELSGTVRDAVLARASRLSDPTRSDLDLLAAVGRPIDRALPEQLGIADGHVDEAVSRAPRASTASSSQRSVPGPVAATPPSSPGTRRRRATGRRSWSTRRRLRSRRAG